MEDECDVCEVSLLRAEVEQQRKEIQHLRGQLLQTCPETPMRKGVPAASRYHCESVAGCPHPVSSDNVTELDSCGDFVDGETDASVAQETLLVQTQHNEQDTDTSLITACPESLAATALRLASTPQGSQRTGVIDTRIVGRTYPPRRSSQAGNGHDVAVSSTHGSKISVSGCQMLACDGASGSRARRSRSTGSVKSRSPSREPRQCMARHCILVPERQLQPPRQPCAAKPRLLSREKRESRPHTYIPLSTSQQTQPRQPRPCKLESRSRPMPVTFVASKPSLAKAEGAMMQLRPQALCPQPPHHQSEDGVGVANPGKMAAVYTTAGIWPAAPDCSMALIHSPSTPTFGAYHVLHVHCATPHTGHVANVARNVSIGESRRSPAHPRVDATGSATHLSHTWLAVPPQALQGTTGTQLGHGRELAERSRPHCLDGGKLLDESVERLPHTGSRRNTSTPASKRKTIVAL